MTLLNLSTQITIKAPFSGRLSFKISCFRYVSNGLEVREITRFPWAYGELPRAEALRDLTMYYDPIGVSQFPGPPCVYEKTETLL